jgi:hypothetical protein
MLNMIETFFAKVSTAETVAATVVVLALAT